MLTPQDLEKLANYLVEVFKDIFATKEDLDELKQSFSDLQTSVDNIANINHTTVGEAAVMAYRMKNAENWIDRAAIKLGIEFRH